MLEWWEDETGKAWAESSSGLKLSAEAWRRGYLYSVTDRDGELVSTGTARSMREAQNDAEDAAQARSSPQSLQEIAEQWVRGREVDLLGARVALAVENAIGTEYLTAEEWHKDPEAWAEELQLYAADTLETIPISALIGLIEGYAAEILA